MSLPTIFFAVILAGAFLAGESQHPAWIIVVIAALAAIARMFDPEARAARAAQGKTLGQALPMLVVNQIIWVNLVFLIGFGIAWALGGPLIGFPLLLPLAVSLAGAAGMLAISLRG
jgi:hypothetical protein